MKFSKKIDFSAEEWVLEGRLDAQRIYQFLEGILRCDNFAIAMYKNATNVREVVGSPHRLI